jgi:hypothetical protein
MSPENRKGPKEAIMIRFADGSTMKFQNPDAAHQEIQRRTKSQKPELKGARIAPDDLKKVDLQPIAEWFYYFGDRAARFNQSMEVVEGFINSNTIFPDADFEVDLLPDNYKGTMSAESEHFTYTSEEGTYLIKALFAHRLLAEMMGIASVEEDLRPIVAEKLNSMLQQE